MVQLRDDVSDLAQVLKYLGPCRDVVYSDYTSDGGGNHERIGFVFDTRAAMFTGLASNIHAPRTTSKKSLEYVAAPDWWRQPYMASFRAGNLDFLPVAAHVRWGANAAGRLPLTGTPAE